MREIKFRAYIKDKEKAKFNFSEYYLIKNNFLLPVAGISFYYPSGLNKYGDPRSDSQVSIYRINGSTIRFNIDEVELLQYIGLKDKNGKEIYEGNIVRFQPNKTIPEELKMMFQGVGEVVSLIDNSFFYMIKVAENKNISFRSVFELEVIGSIYDNTELLWTDKND